LIQPPFAGDGRSISPAGAIGSITYGMC